MTLKLDIGRCRLLLLIGVLLSGGLASVLAQSIADATDKTRSDTEITDYDRTGLLHISGMIDRVRFRYLKRALENAATENLATLIVHIDTDGGEVYYAREMLKLILDQPRAGRRTIAFVGFRAISAGAMIAYGHQTLYISDTATIGDIGVIFVKPGGGIEYAPEKIETVIRALLAQAAEQNGWSRGALLKMTARNQNLYRVVLADGETEYVIEDDLPEFLAEHPDIDKDDEKQVIVYRGKDRLLTLTGREAIKLGMATELMPDLDSLYRQLGIEPETVIDLRPSGIEQLAGILAAWAPLLSGLALLFILFELKTPGVGLWALLGLTFGALFLISQYTLDMIDYLEVILIALGLMLIATEFLTLVGGGLLGVAGAALVFVGLVMAFLPNELIFDLSDERFLDALSSAALNGLIAIGIMALGIFTFIATIPRSRLVKRLAVQAEVSASSVGQMEKSAAVLVGQRGVSRDSLRPGGVVTIDGYDHNARVEYGAFIDAGQTVEVVAVEFGELIVRAIVDGDQINMIEPQWMPILYAVLLLLAGVALLILEFFIVSFGLLSAAALASAVAAVYFAFQLGLGVGYGFIVLATGLTVLTVRWGLARLRSSSAVPKAEISGDAGYHHLAERIGVKVGSIGVLVTPALPSGRARFTGGECDVQVRSGSLEANTKVLVERIDGPIIFVTATEQE